MTAHDDSVLRMHRLDGGEGVGHCTHRRCRQQQQNQCFVPESHEDRERPGMSGPLRLADGGKRSQIMVASVGRRPRRDSV